MLCHFPWKISRYSGKISVTGAKDESGCDTCFCECPTFDAVTCQSQCTQMEKQFIEGAKSIHGCNICQCGCMNRDCSAECQGHQFEIEAGDNGCITRCRCVCPVLDCDAPCGGVGLGIKGPVDKAGCATSCNGCKEPGMYPDYHIISAGLSIHYLENNSYFLALPNFSKQL